MKPTNPAPRGVTRVLPADDVSRRRFLQVMGASMALATASGCRWETEEILPFAKRPEDRVPGTTRRFATALESGSTVASLLVTSYDGRPIKIEGNPLHPIDAGAASARSQACVLDLYDPAHSGGLVQMHERIAYPRTWKEFDPWFASHRDALRATNGRGFRVLAEPSSSLALAAQRARFAELYPAARWIDWEPVTRKNEIDGARLAFGEPVRTQLRIEAAKTLVSLDVDLFEEHPASMALARAFAARRNPDQADVLRLWAIESSPTLTGSAADHRLALRAEQILPFVLELEKRIEAWLGKSAGDPTASREGFLATPTVTHFVDQLGRELAERRGEVLLAVGSRQPAAVHAVVHRIHDRLGCVGRTVVHTDEPEASRDDGAKALAELVREMNDGEVECLVVLGGNPVYDAPAELDLRAALRKVALVVHVAETRNETSRLATWHLPRAHALESWGDCASYDGTRCTIQPLIDPIFERRTALEFVAFLNGDARPARELVRASIAEGKSDAEWKRILHDGFVAGTAHATRAPALQRFTVAAAAPRALAPEVANGELELVLAADPRTFDGRGANNAWLQEAPDPITKTTWGNAAWFAPETAKALGVADATRVRLTFGGRTLEVAAVVVPGQARGSVLLRLGHGRTAAGLVGGQEDEGVEPIGSNAYVLRTASAPDGGSGLRVEPTGVTAPLARTTDPNVDDEIGKHGLEERLHELLRETTLAAWVAHPEIEGSTKKRKPIESLWERPEGDPDATARWGMVIDLNACIGCNACTVACQAENNVPVVGREQVQRGREMHWIRIDRYVTGDEAAPKYRFQPMTCQHCESAPCEQVCPVGATMHSAEGLNDMVYNRCIGTRYCANNCPFKVRRFNYFNYNAGAQAEGAHVLRMRHNPEVTVRHRGVMEKCTFCVQRIQAAKIPAKNGQRQLVDGAVVPACAQTCPTQAIVFGDLADPKSRVARLTTSGRAYTMLDELNLGSRTAYLARITNPNAAAEERHG
ncbi:MAG: 4Fe-4S dicluster domain-containing protein [Planctomycetes bacterium]|nr:4Fe-4S dicluster domain-containing protein [Planctomycetota bacterium]